MFVRSDKEQETSFVIANDPLNNNTVYDGLWAKLSRDERRKCF